MRIVGCSWSLNDLIEMKSFNVDAEKPKFENQPPTVNSHSRPVNSWHFNLINEFRIGLMIYVYQFRICFISSLLLMSFTDGKTCFFSAHRIVSMPMANEEALKLL